MSLLEMQSAAVKHGVELILMYVSGAPLPSPSSRCHCNRNQS